MVFRLVILDAQFMIAPPLSFLPSFLSFFLPSFHHSILPSFLPSIISSRSQRYSPLCLLSPSFSLSLSYLSDSRHRYFEFFKNLFVVELDVVSAVLPVRQVTSNDVMLCHVTLQGSRLASQSVCQVKKRRQVCFYLCVLCVYLSICVYICLCRTDCVSICVYLSMCVCVYLLQVMAPGYHTPLPLKSPSTLSPSLYTTPTTTSCAASTSTVNNIRVSE
jgi:hypothetical protein